MYRVHIHGHEIQVTQGAAKHLCDGSISDIVDTVEQVAVLFGILDFSYSKIDIDRKGSAVVWIDGKNIIY